MNNVLTLRIKVNIQAFVSEKNSFKKYRKIGWVSYNYYLYNYQKSSSNVDKKWINDEYTIHSVQKIIW